MLGNGPVQFGKGATEKGWQQYLAGALLHSEEGGWKRAMRIAPRQPPILQSGEQGFNELKKLMAWFHHPVPDTLLPL